jgi:ABC-2 type transport system ATP-binding protein
VDNIIEITHLSKSYGRARGIDDISLSVNKGDIFGFIGPNGAGKSTTIRILLNLIFPTSGSASIMGLDVVRESKKIRNRMGYIPSDANMYDRLRVGDFLEYCASYYSPENPRERIRILADRFDLDLSRKIHDLSTGNRKKVSILQALAHKPELLILDEPTTGLDPLVQASFFDLLTEENNRGMTIFFSSHILSEVQTFCKTVAIIRNGKIAAVEEIGSLRKKQLKKVRVGYAPGRYPGKLDIEGITSLETASGGFLEFFFSGDINTLVGKLADGNLDTLTIEEPPLEEIFLHYYKA